MPVLTAAGCNSGACHGKSRGQNGFQLSLLGFDADSDYAALVEHARGRRVSPASPAESLLLVKATAAVPHGGGRRLEPDGERYDVVLRWIERGMPRSTADDARLVGIAIDTPAKPLAPRERAALAITASYSDGSTRDVTGFTAFQSNEPAIAAVDESGVITAGDLAGETSIMARYMGHIATWAAAIPFSGEIDAAVYERLPRRNFVDEHVWRKLRELGIVPSGSATETTLLRRAYLDSIGRLPSADEVRGYLADTREDRYERLVDRLLERPEYADFWANKWADLLRPNPYRVGIKATLAFDAWIRDAFRRNMRYDQFVRELVTARGSTWHNGAAVLYRDRRTPDELTTIASQLFLGMRLECAKCHHHPFEVWGQDDFYSLAAYFARVGRKGSGVSPPISGGEEIIFTSDSGVVAHPLTGQTMKARPLFGEAKAVDDAADPRATLAAWIASRENPNFTRTAVNRVWADLMGIGLVDPVDDLRATNPASNAPLLDVLASDFCDHGFDLKHLLRVIMTSHAYRLSSLPAGGNAADLRNYSRHYRQRLRAEVLLDAVCDVTGVPEDFAAMPDGSRAVELWTHRVDSLFLDAFGRPDRNQDPPCERTLDTTVVQTLHLMNAPALHGKVTSDEGRAARLAAGELSNAAIVEELYLSTYSRPPSADESQAALAIFGDDTTSRRRATEDLMWALMNTPEFLFKD